MKKQIQLLLVSQPELWLVSKHKPALENIKLTSEAEVGDWTLWKLTKSP